MPTKVRFHACQVSAAAQESFAQKVLLGLGKPESVLWHHLCISMVDSRLLVYATPVVVGGRLRGYAWCGMQLSPPPPVPGGSAQAAHRHCTRPFPGESGLATQD